MTEEIVRTEIDAAVTVSVDRATSLVELIVDVSKTMGYTDEPRAMAIIARLIAGECEAATRLGIVTGLQIAQGMVGK